MLVIFINFEKMNLYLLNSEINDTFMTYIIEFCRKVLEIIITYTNLLLAVGSDCRHTMDR